MSDPHVAIPLQFDDPIQQREAATLGMWVFLAAEIVFFGGAFVTYAAAALVFRRHQGLELAQIEDRKSKRAALGPVADVGCDLVTRFLHRRVDGARLH